MSTKTRVSDHTSDAVNEHILLETKQRVEYYLAHPEDIEKRLKELDEEWDTERTLETNSSLISLFGLAMGFAVNRRWFLLPLAVQTFFLQHAVQGWCPPLPILRRLGIRTADEISSERTALEAIRGDFKNLSENSSYDTKPFARTVLEAVTQA